MCSDKGIRWYNVKYFAWYMYMLFGQFCNMDGNVFGICVNAIMFQGVSVSTTDLIFK